MTVWLDRDCLTPPSGVTNRLFVKFNYSFGFGSEWLWGGYQDIDKMLFVFTPTDQAPDETYQVRGFRNFLSEEQRSPFEVGDVIEIVNVLESVDVSNIQTEFYL